MQGKSNGKWPGVAAWQERWIDLVFPRSCLLTAEQVDAEAGFRYLSAAAQERILYARAPFCRCCGYPFWGEAAEEQACPRCLLLNPVFQEGRTVALMRGPPRQMLLTLKYHRGFFVLPDLARMARAVEGYLDFLAGAVLVPVPLHPAKLRKRGFNQSRLLAETLAEETSGAEVMELLVRIRRTESQTRFRRRDRVKNVAGAFALRPGATIDAARRYVVVDDVFTTGSTLNACCAVLAAARVNRVDVATFCHG